MLRPPALEADAHVRVVAPSSPFDRARFDAGQRLLEGRYRLTLADGLFDRAGFLAGSDAQRCAALTDALTAPDVHALVAARGGYGATRLLASLDVALIARATRWLVGFSDVTALHALWARAGLCSIHGPMVASLPEACPAYQAEWFRLLEGGPPTPMTGLSCVVPGRAEGRLFGGNLTVLSALVGTPYMPALNDCVLLLEDIAERPYRIDRMLTSLLQSGTLTGVRAVILGQFTQCDAGADGVTAEAVLAERLRTLGIPVVGDAPVGHVPDNKPVLLGARVAVDAAAGLVCSANA